MKLNYIFHVVILLDVFEVQPSLLSTTSGEVCALLTLRRFCEPPQVQSL